MRQPAPQQDTYHPRRASSRPLKARLKSSLIAARKRLPNDPGGRVVVLCYHSIHPTKPFASVSPELFEQQMRWLSEHCSIIPFDRVSNALEDGHGSTETPTVAVTIDDGYADNYEYAFPVLEQLGIPATIYLTIGLMERDEAVLERMQWLLRADIADVTPLEWSQVHEMRDSDIQFGCHTYSHPNLAHLDRSAATDEIVRSKEIMEERMDEAVATFAYPFGRINRHFKAETVELVAKAGFDSAASVACRAVRVSDLPFGVARFWVEHDDIDTFRDRVMGVYDFLSPFQEHMPLWAARRLMPEDFDV